MRLFALSLFFLTAALGQPQPKLCSVTLRVVDSAGKPVAHSVKSFVDEYGKDFAASFTSLKGRVPCQSVYYSFELTRNGITSRKAIISGKVWVNDAENWLTLTTNPNLHCMTPDRCGEPSFSIIGDHVWRGQIVPAPPERLWVQFRSVVSDRLAEAEVDTDGSFRIYDTFYPGSYQISITNEQGQIVYWSPVTLTRMTFREILRIRLPAKPPTSLIPQ